MNVPRQAVRRRRNGFTLVETLVACGVIGALVAILLPALQQSRESARRLQCAGNFRQLALALHEYHEANNVLPAGSYVLGPSFITQTGWGWEAMILPQVDQLPLFEQIDFTRPTAYGNNEALIRSSIPLFRCPTDIQPLAIVAIGPDNNIYTAATGNYVGIEGLLSEMSAVRFAQVTDGLSNTLMLGERVFRPSISGSDEFTSSWCGQLASSNSYVFNSIPHLDVTPLHRINASLLFPHCFSSRHAAGVNFAFADGSVHFVSQTINQDVLIALGTPRGGEVVEF